jgi:hypothetical protein
VVAGTTGTVLPECSAAVARPFDAAAGSETAAAAPAVRSTATIARGALRSRVIVSLI